MKLLQLKCPTCGAKLEVSDQLKSFTCNYCGQVTMMDDEIIKVEHKIIGNAKNEAYERVEGFFKLEYYDSALKLSYELTDKYPSDSQAWIYLIKAFTHDFTLQPDNEEFLDKFKEYFKNYTIFEKDKSKLAKNKKKYEEYLSKFDDVDFWGTVIIIPGKTSTFFGRYEIFIDGEEATTISPGTSVEMEVAAGARVLQINETMAFEKSGKYKFYLKANETLSFDISYNHGEYSVILDGVELKPSK